MLDSPLHASRVSLETINDCKYWESLCPELHVNNLNLRKKIKKRKVSPCSEVDNLSVRTRLIQEGYALLNPSQLNLSVEVGKIAAGILQLQAYGWPATAITMFDEVWALGDDASRLMQQATGNSSTLDILAFFVDPLKNSGFSAHRDRQPEDWIVRGWDKDVRSTFRKDGTARYTTMWLALTNASSDSSCMHYIPASADPGYFAGDQGQSDANDSEGAQDPVQRVLAAKNGLQSIRAAPVVAGGAVFHTHRIIHWGNAGRACAEVPVPPRVSLSFTFSDPDFEPPYLQGANTLLPFPPLHLRLALMAVCLHDHSGHTYSHTNYIPTQNLIIILSKHSLGH
jgi:hypothetical protein